MQTSEIPSLAILVNRYTSLSCLYFSQVAI
jgi:hypothetical protein